MLVELAIKNYAIITDLNIAFEKGLNVITGETGAGKSIIFDALNVSLGARGSRDVLKFPDKNAHIDSVFELTSSDKLFAKEQLDFDCEDTVIFSKEVRPNGSTSSKIDGKIFTQGAVQGFSDKLIHIYGQHEQLELMDEKNHISLLDQMGDEDFRNTLSEYRKDYDEYRSLLSEFKDFNLDEEALNRELDFYNFQISEINEVSLVSGEDEELEYEEQKLSHQAELITLVSEINDLFNGREYGFGGLLSDLNFLSEKLKSISHIDGEREKWVERAESIYFEMEDLKREVSGYLSSLNPDDERLYEVRERLNSINKLKMKYGKTIEEILDYLENTEKKYEELLSYNERMENAREELSSKKKSLIEKASVITDMRKNISENLSKALEAELKELNMKDTVIRVEFEESDLSENGADSVRFMISTNKNMPLKPLSKIASGGEMSRIMLGLKTVVSESFCTLVFDEIDTGISGAAVKAVGLKLKALSKNHQVIVISHLPQIAAIADTHFLIRKESDALGVSTTVVKLNEEERIREIAALLSGESETALKHAKEMINEYKGGHNGV